MHIQKKNPSFQLLKDKQQLILQLQKSHNWRQNYILSPGLYWLLAGVIFNGMN